MSGSNVSEEKSGRVLVPVLLAAYTFSPLGAAPFLRESEYSVRLVYVCSFFVPAVYFLASTAVCLFRRAWLDAAGAAFFACWSVVVLSIARRAL